MMAGGSGAQRNPGGLPSGGGEPGELVEWQSHGQRQGGGCGEALPQEVKTVGTLPCAPSVAAGRTAPRCCQSAHRRQGGRGPPPRKEAQGSRGRGERPALPRR